MSQQARSCLIVGLEPKYAMAADITARKGCLQIHPVITEKADVI